MLACGIYNCEHTVFSKYIFHAKKSQNLIKMKHVYRSDTVSNKFPCQSQEGPREWLSGLSFSNGKYFSKEKKPVQNEEKILGRWSAETHQEDEIASCFNTK